MRELVGTHDPADDLWKALIDPDSPNFKSSAKATSQVASIAYRRPGWELAPPVKDGHRQVDRDREKARQYIPFNDETDSDYARIIDANELWYQAVMQTEPGPVGIWWMDYDENAIALPVTDIHHQLLDAFQLRASLAFGRGDIEIAIESVEFMFKIVERERTIPFLTNQQVGSGLEAEALSCFCAGVLTTDDVPKSVLHDWDKRRFTPNWDRWSKTIETTRLQMLQILQYTHRDRGSTQPFDNYTRAFGQRAGNWFVNRVDFDAAMSEVNRAYDEASAAFRIKRYSESDRR